MSCFHSFHPFEYCHDFTWTIPYASIMFSLYALVYPITYLWLNKDFAPPCEIRCFSLLCLTTLCFYDICFLFIAMLLVIVGPYIEFPIHLHKYFISVYVQRIVSIVAFNQFFKMLVFVLYNLLNQQSIKWTSTVGLRPTSIR